MGLREEKQTRQRAVIIENAVALFSQRGFDAVPVREIAQACAVSEATFFNYFGTNGALLREWAGLELETSLAFGIRQARSGGLRRVVRQWSGELARRVEGQPELMAEAWSRMRLDDLGTGPGAELGAEVGAGFGPARGRQPHSDSLVALIATAQKAGEVRGDLEPKFLAQLIRNCLAGSISTWYDDGPGDQGVGSLQQRMVRGAGVLLDGFRKRNERVPAPRASQKSNSLPPGY